jgi:hypothetical protein
MNRTLFSIQYTLTARAWCTLVVFVMVLSSAPYIEVTRANAVFARGTSPVVMAATTPPSGSDDDDDDDDDSAQPVRVGDLIGRDIVAPVESQDLLGHVAQVVRKGDDDVILVMTHGGFLGFGARSVCVPADDLALTGKLIQAKDISPAEIDALPPCAGAGATPLDQNESIKMNLAKPAH